MVLDVTGLDEFHRRRDLRKSVVEELARFVVELGMKRFRPNRLATFARVESSAERKGIDDGARSSDREMKMWKFGVAGQANQSDWLVLDYPIARFDAYTTPGHVAVLCVPAVLVFQNDPIAAFFPFYPGLSGASHGDVSHSIS
jgi:hypothetical protein